FVAYLGMEENKKMKVPYFGNKQVLDWEENRKMQREWMEKSGIKVPHRFKKGDKIDRSVIVKSYGAAGGKGYFVARNQKEFDEKWLYVFGKVLNQNALIEIREGWKQATRNLLFKQEADHKKEIEKLTIKYKKYFLIKITN
ncbi:MAG: DUF1246 domain-containing protein, partial [Nanoarchaeota archaeon]